MGLITLPSAIDMRSTLFAVSKRRCELSLSAYIKEAWHVIEPGRPYVHNWHIDFICAHLEAITDDVQFDDGTFYNRLLANVPPGTMKSLIVNVFWPSWEWGPRNMPHLRYVCASHNVALAVRDGLKMRRLIKSEWYMSRWGDRVVLTSDQNEKRKFENSATGFRQATAFEGMTGVRGDRVIIDDPHSVDSANSDAERESAVLTFKEAVPTRLNDPERSAIVVIMQRLHEGDVSGVILDGNMGYDHIMLPMRYDPGRAAPTMLGYEDPRTYEGELLFPQRFPASVVDRDEDAMGPYATAGQFQQRPTPRGGGIIKPDWWQLWDANEYPQMEYIVASLDTAFTTKTENDPSAMTVWGVFAQSPDTTTTRSVDRYGNVIESTVRTFTDGSVGAVPKVMLMYAWAERLELHDLVAKVEKTCRMFRVDNIIIENKAAGHSVAQELRRLFSVEDFGVHMYDPKTLDKMARLYSVQHIFSEGMVFAPDKLWAENVIQEVSTFPRGKHDDLTDTVSMGIKYLRDIGLLTRGAERLKEMTEARTHRGAPPKPLYPV